jgi:hypothetical protein
MKKVILLHISALKENGKGLSHEKLNQSFIY